MALVFSSESNNGRTPTPPSSRSHPVGTCSSATCPHRPGHCASSWAWLCLQLKNLPLDKGPAARACLAREITGKKTKSSKQFLCLVISNLLHKRIQSECSHTPNSFYHTRIRTYMYTGVRVGRQGQGFGGVPEG